LLPFRRFKTDDGTLIRIDEGKINAINGLVTSQAYEAIFSHNLSNELEQAFNQLGRNP